MGVQPFWSVDDLICSETGEGLTFWMGVQPFWSVDLICSRLERDSHAGWVFSHSGQWIWSAQMLESNSQPAILVSESDLVKHWRGTHSLDECPAILVSGSDLFKHRRGTHSLDVQPFWSVDLICLNTGERPTCWMGVQPFWLVDLIC